jgi:hypothetical protein
MDISPQRISSLGASAYQNMRAFVGRSAKVSGPITVVCGVVSDLASTIGKFSLYLFLISIVTALVAGVLWFVRYRRIYLAAAEGGITEVELAEIRERNVWSVLFAFSIVASIVMGWLRARQGAFRR